MKRGKVGLNQEEREEKKPTEPRSILMTYKSRFRAHHSLTAGFNMRKDLSDIYFIFRHT